MCIGASLLRIFAKYGAFLFVLKRYIPLPLFDNPSPEPIFSILKDEKLKGDPWYALSVSAPKNLS